MLYNEWSYFYKKISQDLNLDINIEKIAANNFNNILKQKKSNLVTEKDLQQLIKNKNIIIFGAGPSLEKTLDFYRKKIQNMIKISADGATTALINNNIVPDIIVTDLDGKIEDQIKANKLGCTVLIHAHGDNQDKIKKYILEFKGNIFGTIQINPEPYKNLYNYGGFTDGDRAVFIADHFNAKKILLAGFDFNEKIGKYSYTKNSDTRLKLKKLKWCKYLINTLIKDKQKIQFLKI